MYESLINIHIFSSIGTGKTATVLSTINALQKEAKQGQLPAFSFIEINCLQLRCPIDAYTKLWSGLSGQHLGPNRALKRLVHYFSGDEVVLSASSSNSSNTAATTTNATTNTSYHMNRITVCLVDEMDYLITRNFDVLYHFYAWPTAPHTTFILIGIANTMDVPERLALR